MNDFYNEPRHINMKKVFLLIVAIGFICLIAILLIAKAISKPKQENNVPKSKASETTTIFYSTNKTESVELSNSFKLEQFNTNPNYIIDLRSEDNLDIYISKENKIENRKLSEIVEADKTVFVNGFEGYSNLSETKELSVNNNLAYTYSFHYLDKTLYQAYYIQVTWIEIGDKYYIFDIEFPLDDLSFNTNISSDVLVNFQVQD